MYPATWCIWLIATPFQVIDQMHQVAGYTVVIVCTSSQGMEDYWQARLEAGKGQVIGCSFVLYSSAAALLLFFHCSISSAALFVV